MRLHTTTDYANDRYNFLKLLEDYKQFTYVDSEGIPTIGVGINLQTHQDLVLQIFGFDLSRTLTGQADADEQGYISRIQAELNSDTHTTTSLQAALKTIMDARYDNTNYPPDFYKRPYFAFLGFDPTGEEEAKAVFDQVMAGYTVGGRTVRGYETQLDDWFAEKGIAPIGQSKERIALVSLAFNGRDRNGDGFSDLLGNKLAAAMHQNVTPPTASSFRRISIQNASMKSARPQTATTPWAMSGSKIKSDAC